MEQTAVIDQPEINCPAIDNAKQAATSILKKLGDLSLSGIKCVSRGIIHVGEAASKGIKTVRKIHSKASMAFAEKLAKTTLELTNKLTKKFADVDLFEELQNMEGDLSEAYNDLKLDFPEFNDMKQSIQELLVHSMIKMEKTKAKVSNYYNKFKEWANCKSNVTKSPEETEPVANASTTATCIAEAEHMDKSVEEKSLDKIQDLNKQTIQIMKKINPSLASISETILEDILSPEDMKKIATVENRASTFSLAKKVVKSSIDFINSATDLDFEITGPSINIDQRQNISKVSSFLGEYPQVTSTISRKSSETSQERFNAFSESMCSSLGVRTTNVQTKQKTQSPMRQIESSQENNAEMI